MGETTFENAKIGDRVYSPLYACKNQGDKTNAVIKEINVGRYALLVVPDITDELSFAGSFTIDGKFIPSGGQMLFWENPINSIPIRPKRKVTKKGWIGITNIARDKNESKIVAHTTNLYSDKAELEKIYDWIRIVKEIEFEVEE